MEEQKNLVGSGIMASSFLIIIFWEYIYYLIAHDVGLNGNFVHEMRLTFFLRLIETVSLLFFTLFFSDLKGIGFERSKALPGLKSGVLWSIIFGATAFSGIFILWMSGTGILKYFRIDFVKNTEEIFWFYLAAGLSGPIAEEIFFRGIVFGYFRRHGFITAAILSTFFFVFAHSSVTLPVTQLIGGLVFCWFYEKTGSLITPMIIHITGNMAIFTIGIFQKFL